MIEREYPRSLAKERKNDCEEVREEKEGVGKYLKDRTGKTK